MLDTPQLTGASHTRLHLVGDQQDLVLVTDLTQARPEVVGRDNRAGFTLHRFHDDGGDVVANFASNTQLLLNGIGVAKGNVEDVIVQWHGGTAENGLTGKG